MTIFDCKEKEIECFCCVRCVTKVLQKHNSIMIFANLDKRNLKTLHALTRQNH